MSTKTTQIVSKLAAPIIEEKEMELVDVEFKKEGQNWFLRVYIDKDGGVDLEDCSDISNVLSQLLDEQDPIPQAYFLEVSSPGAERPLKKERDFKAAVGKHINIKTYEPIDGEKEFQGLLTQYDEEGAILEIKIKNRIKKIASPGSKIAAARLAIVF